MSSLLVCTRGGLVRLDGDGSSWERVVLLEGTPTRCVARAGLYRWEADGPWESIVAMTVSEPS